jgi:hypothetical protein
MNKTCVHCGKVFEPTARELKRPSEWAVRRYCTQRCSGTVNGALASGRNRKVVPPKPCLTCGKEFSRHAKGETPWAFAKRRYCCRSCVPRTIAPRKAAYVPHPPCVVCSGDVARHQGESAKRYLERLTCSEHCARVRRHRTRMKSLVSRPEKNLNGWQQQVYAHFNGRQGPARHPGIRTVEEFLATRGVTRCPAAYAGVSTGQISDEERAAHAERYAEMERQRQANVKRRGVSA